MGKSRRAAQRRGGEPKVRVDINVPADVRRRMLGHMNDFNWSAVCTSAIVRAIDEAEGMASAPARTIDERLGRLERILGVGGGQEHGENDDAGGANVEGGAAGADGGPGL